MTTERGNSQAETYPDDRNILSFGCELEFLVAYVQGKEPDPNAKNEGLAPILRIPDCDLLPKDHPRQDWLELDHVLAHIMSTLRDAGLVVQRVGTSADSLPPSMYEDDNVQSGGAIRLPPDIDADRSRQMFGIRVMDDRTILEADSLEGWNGYRFQPIEITTSASWTSPVAFKELELVTQLMLDNYRIRVHRNCGLQYHTGNGPRPFSTQTLKRTVALLWCLDPLICQIHPPQRRRGMYTSPFRENSAFARDCAFHLSNDVFFKGGNIGKPYAGGNFAPMDLYQPARTRRFHFPRLDTSRAAPEDHKLLEDVYPDGMGGKGLAELNFDDLQVDSALDGAWRFLACATRADLLTLLEIPAHLHRIHPNYSFSGYQGHCGVECPDDWRCNTHTFSKLTIEFREAVGSMDAEWITAWGRICAAIVLFAQNASTMDFFLMTTRLARTQGDFGDAVPGNYDFIDFLDDIGCFAEAEFLELKMQDKLGFWYPCRDLPDADGHSRSAPDEAGAPPPPPPAWIPETPIENIFAPSLKSPAWQVPSLPTAPDPDAQSRPAPDDTSAPPPPAPWVPETPIENIFAPSLESPAWQAPPLPTDAETFVTPQVGSAPDAAVAPPPPASWVPETPIENIFATPLESPGSQVPPLPTTADTVITPQQSSGWQVPTLPTAGFWESTSGAPWSLGNTTAQFSSWDSNQNPLMETEITGQQNTAQPQQELSNEDVEMGGYTVPARAAPDVEMQAESAPPEHVYSEIGHVPTAPEDAMNFTIPVYNGSTVVPALHPAFFALGDDRDLDDAMEVEGQAPAVLQENQSASSMVCDPVSLPETMPPAQFGPISLVTPLPPQTISWAAPPPPQEGDGAQNATRADDAAMEVDNSKPAPKKWKWKDYRLQKKAEAEAAKAAAEAAGQKEAQDGRRANDASMEVEEPDLEPHKDNPSTSPAVPAPESFSETKKPAPTKIKLNTPLSRQKKAEAEKAAAVAAKKKEAEKAAAVAARKKEAQDAYDQAFPHSYDLVDVSGAGLLCGPRALRESIWHQYPEFRTRDFPSTRKLIHLQEKADFYIDENGNVLKDVKAKNNFLVDHVAGMLQNWGRTLNLPQNLRMGIVKTNPQGYDDVELLPAPDGDDQRVVWVWNNGKSDDGKGLIGHYQGMRPRPPPGTDDTFVPSPDDSEEEADQTSEERTGEDTATAVPAGGFDFNSPIAPAVAPVPDRGTADAGRTAYAEEDEVDWDL